MGLEEGYVESQIDSSSNPTLPINFVRQQALGMGPASMMPTGGILL